MTEVRENWRELPVVDLTDSEVELMSKQDVIWCIDLLAERARLRSPAAVAAHSPASATERAGNGGSE